MIKDKSWCLVHQFNWMLPTYSLELFFAFHLANFFELAAAAAWVCEAHSGQKTFFSGTLFLPLKKHTPIKTVRGAVNGRGIILARNLFSQQQRQQQQQQQQQQPPPSKKREILNPSWKRPNLLTKQPFGRGMRTLPESMPLKIFFFCQHC